MAKIKRLILLTSACMLKSKGHWGHKEAREVFGDQRGVGRITHTLVIFFDSQIWFLLKSSGELKIRSPLNKLACNTYKFYHKKHITCAENDLGKIPFNMQNINIKCFQVHFFDSLCP